MFVQQKNLTRKNMLYNLKTESLYDHINCFREIILEKMQKPSREDESHEEFVQRQLKINSGKDWIRSVLALILLKTRVFP